jgi:hypothetical protein
LRQCAVNVLLSEIELGQRFEALRARGGFAFPASQTPWHEIQRAITSQIDIGMVLEPAVKYQRIANTKGIPRHNHRTHGGVRLHALPPQRGEHRRDKSPFRCRAEGA